MDWGFLAQSRDLVHDRDGKFSPVFRAVIKGGKVRPLRLSARIPNLNAFAERWVRWVKARSDWAVSLSTTTAGQRESLGSDEYFEPYGMRCAKIPFSVAAVPRVVGIVADVLTFGPRPSELEL